MAGICILGGTGFIGRHLCEKFQARGLSAFTVSRNPDRAFLASYAPTVLGLTFGSSEADEVLSTCDVLIHLASSSLPGINWNDPAQELAQSTLVEVQFLQNFARTNGRAHIIFASSGGQIYGSGHSLPINEGVPPAPCTAYALGKQVTEAALNCLSLVEGNVVTILRIANPVGRWQLGRKHGFISTAVTAGLSGKSLTLFGDGNNVRDYFDADDLANFLVDLSINSNSKTGIYNVGSNCGYTENEIILLVSEIVARPIDIEIMSRRPFDLKYSVLDSSRAHEELGWIPMTNLEKSIRKIAKAYLH